MSISYSLSSLNPFFKLTSFWVWYGRIRHSGGHMWLITVQNIKCICSLITLTVCSVSTTFILIFYMIWHQLRISITKPMTLNYVFTEMILIVVSYFNWYSFLTKLWVSLLTFTMNLVKKPFRWKCQPRAELNTCFWCVYMSDPLPTALNLIGPRAMDVLAELSYVSMTPDHFPSMFCKVGNKC